MTEKITFTDLPGFKETIERIARVPYKEGAMPQESFTYCVTDESHKITYKLISRRELSAADVRRAMVRAFNRTDTWPDDAGIVEITV